METADYSVLPKGIFNDVYEPSEDTFIMLDALEKDLNFIERRSPAICLEIGSGTGVITTSLGKVLGSAFYLCTDINPIAAAATKAVGKSNDVPVDAVVTDLVTVFQNRLEKLVDLLIFNPPYAVSPSDEVAADNLHRATSGGVQGREVMDRLFPIVPKLLSASGLFYLTCIAANGIRDIENCLSVYNLEMSIVLNRKCGIEHLYVLRFSFKFPK